MSRSSSVGTAQIETAESSALITRQTQEMTPNQRRDALADLVAEIESKDGRSSGPGRPSQSHSWKGQA